MMAYTHDYHRDADILEVFFVDEEATASVCLTPDITLHFRAEDGKAVSLIFNDFFHLARSDEYGPQAFRLEVERWPEPLRAVVWRILASPPVSDWLAVSSYRPPRVHQAIPLAAVRSVPVSVG